MRRLILLALLLMPVTAMAQTQFLRQSTATAVNIEAVLLTTGVTDTGATVTGITFALVKQSDTFASTVTTWTAAASGSSHDCVAATTGGNTYSCELTASDTDTLGRLHLSWNKSGTLTGWKDFTVIAQAAYDANVSGSLAAAADVTAIKAKTDALVFTVANKVDANVYTWNGTAVATPATAGYPAVTIKDGTGTGEIDTLSGSIVNVDLTDTVTTYTGNTLQTGDSFARLGAPTGASISADIQTRGTHSVKRATAFEWGMKFVDSAGAPVTSGTPSCTRSIDSISAFSATTNTASAVTAAGRSELTVSAADMTGTYYVWLLCTLAGAVDYEYIFKIEAA